ncbi:hypothetical protein WA026_005270 [Henosepilachna vigintioctopunctata]|uniref:Cytochrome P450 n=1 Tax=Henosepilachna vigintioctopunctata TaxID=420089 RepID=A0AAW1UP67_9CUCU
MFFITLYSQLSFLFIIILVIVILLIIYENLNIRKSKTSDNGLLEPPMPFKIPLIGHLHLLGGYDVPYKAFSELGKKYGNIIKLQLGNVKCVVINDQKNIREALITKGHHFDSRPSFERYARLFSGNKQNSLAFCDWSDVQKTRREMLIMYTFPRAATNKFHNLETIIQNNVQSMVSKICENNVVGIKPMIIQHCGNIFTTHFCSRQFQNTDKEFVDMVNNFDEIFYEVNQGYAADFLPFLMPLHKRNLKRMANMTANIKKFVLERIIGDRFENFDAADEPSDYVESLIQHVKKVKSFDWEMALFALEDIIGGHSAVANFLVKLFAFLLKEPTVQQRIQNEIDNAVGIEGRAIGISDRNKLPYTEATIFEAIRLIASPIVPRVSNQDSSIDGYKIEQDTLIFLNNYDLSMSEKLWDEPKKFLPERFLKNGSLVKPDHFLPFGGGKRSCMGYKMVQLISFGVLSGLLQHYTIEPFETKEYKIPIGSLALPRDPLQIKFTKRAVSL